MPLLSAFLRRRILLRSWSWYQWEKTLKKLNSYHGTTTMTMTMRMMKKKNAMRLKMKVMRNTLP
jgi:hypothetical protein